MKTLFHVADQLGVTLTADELDTFEAYYQELIIWNSRFNLTTVTDREEVQIKHFADSLAVAGIIDEMAETSDLSLIDIGSGAGFPGVPLKIIRPAWHVVLVDSTRKKTDFLAHLIRQLDLKNIEVVWARVEEIGRNPTFREQFDVAVARAVADLTVLAEYGLPLLQRGGQLIAQKGSLATDELKTAAKAVKLLGGYHRETRSYTLPGYDKPLQLVVLEKVEFTVAKYPRRPGVPSKRPLR